MSIDYDTIKELVKAAVEEHFSTRNESYIKDLYGVVLEQIEAPLLEMVLKRARYNKSLAAKWLGISRKTILRRLRVYDLTL